jgi:hypothetical protein
MADHKRDFMTGCAEKVPNAPDYCECGWEQMTKLFSEEDLKAPEADKTKLAQLGDRTRAVCGSKVPEPAVKAQFLEACVAKQTELAGYCECKWAEIRKTLSVSELTDDSVVKSERFAAAKKGMVKACAAKVPEASVRDGFMAGCASKDSLKPFCGCAWKTLRAERSPAEFLEGFVDAEAAAPKLQQACGKLRPAK